MSEAVARPIWLCADDYGISPAVSAAIRDLVLHRRINATSVMVVAPNFNRSEAASLALLNAGESQALIGLHVVLSAPFRPLTPGFAPLRKGAFLPLRQMLGRAMLRTLSPARLQDEVAAQLQAFAAAFGRPPDFVDGHQHVHQFPQVSTAFLKAVKGAAPQAWVRQCGRAAVPRRELLADKKGLVLDLLSRRFRREAAALGIATNPAFAGTYNFAAAAVPDFAELFPRFLEGLPAGGLLMCHPGKVDAELERLDPLTGQREHEYAFFAGDRVPVILKDHGATLA